MGTYATTSDLQARLAGRTFSASSKPTLTQIGDWITTGESMISAALKSAQVSTPVTDSDGIQLVKSLVLDYVEGRTRIAVASGAVDEQDAIGLQMVKDFSALCLTIGQGEGAALWAQMMGQGGQGSGSCAVRSHVLANDDDEDFEPTFEADEVW